MASSHRIVLPNKRIIYAPMSETEIRVARNMRQKGFLLQEIADVLERSQRAVWMHTADVVHRNWYKDRYLQRPRAGSMAHLLDNVA